MPRNYPILDTNIILRFLLADNEKQATAAAAILQQKDKKYWLPDQVIAEIIYVLLSFYHFNKNSIIESIKKLINHDVIYADKKTINSALDIYMIQNISFIDAYLKALVENNKSSFIYTFDKQLATNNKKQVKLLE